MSSSFFPVPGKVTIKKMEQVIQEAGGSGPDPRQVIISLLSMCIFPFAARPVVTEILFNGDHEAFIEAMEQRKILVPLMMREIMMMKKPKP